MSDDAYPSVRLQLRAEFRYVLRLSGEMGCRKNYWGEKVQQDRRYRSLLGYAVPCQGSFAYQFSCNKGA